MQQIAGSPTNADAWTFDTFLTATRDRHKSGHPFGIGVGTAATCRNRRRYL
jgi:hypothetical protein